MSIQAIKKAGHQVEFLPPYPMPRMKAMNQMVAAAASDINLTYEQQSIDFTDQVDVVFELKRYLLFATLSLSACFILNVLQDASTLPSRRHE